MGVNYGFKLSEEGKLSSGDWEPLPEIVHIRNTDFGLTGRVKVEFNNFSLFTRYYLGLSELAEWTYTDLDGNDLGSGSHISRGLHIGLGYAFRKS